MNLQFLFCNNTERDTFNINSAHKSQYFIYLHCHAIVVSDTLYLKNQTFKVKTRMTLKAYGKPTEA